MFVTFDAAI